MPRIVVTGADGFIGRPLTGMLTQAGLEVSSINRKEFVLGSPESSGMALESALQQSQAVIHLAGRAHVMREAHHDPLAEFRRINVDGTLEVAEAAAKAGVKRFVFMSSIGVLGNTSGTAPLNEGDRPSPNGPYAISKWEAERALQSLAQRTGLQLVIVRPPLVYGANVKGNFLRLLRLVRSELPLPFGSVHNRRSYVGVHNLCEFLLLSVTHPAAAGKTFHVADGEDISTPQLLRMLAAAMDRKAWTFHCPPALLRAAAGCIGKRAELERLTSNLQVDAKLAQLELGWRPTKTMQDGIREMVQQFVAASVL